jgi:hypothetical protein
MTEENSFPTIMKSFIMIMLFSFLILSAVLIFAGNYGQDTTQVTDRIGLQAINDTLASTQGQATKWEETFFSATSDPSLLDILGFIAVQVFRLARTMATFIFLPFAIFSNILVNVLGVPIIVANILNVLIILGIIFGIWSLIRRGV